MNALKKICMYVVVIAGAMFFNAGFCDNITDDEDDPVPETSNELKGTQWGHGGITTEGKSAALVLSFTTEKKGVYEYLINYGKSNQVAETYNFTYTYVPPTITLKFEDGDMMTAKVNGSSFTLYDSDNNLLDNLTRFTGSDVPGLSGTPDDPTTPDPSTDAVWDEYVFKYPILKQVPKFNWVVDQFKILDTTETIMGVTITNKGVVVFLKSLDATAIDDYLPYVSYEGYKVTRELEREKTMPNVKRYHTFIKELTDGSSYSGAITLYNDGTATYSIGYVTYK